MSFRDKETPAKQAWSNVQDMQTWGGTAGSRETEIVLSQNAFAGVSRLKSRVGDSCP
ncbi:hypothetical protein CYANOKiyG1_56600 [Okeania sp. KiyG1]|nr:hypothetical protein CYANOKiyG1_00310 [Okeania sp. KiyG1]GGA31049.1 hypothetical protein CYANOKiyG1_47720 [Okeania sp. KiyG1]GGA38425.1 hypothetical protein CYANOKiyG1_56600 [Okeania sp. KiyG1]